MTNQCRPRLIATVLAFAGLCACAHNLQADPSAVFKAETQVTDAPTAPAARPRWYGSEELRVAIEETNGLPKQIETGVGPSQRRWLTAASTLTVRQETTGAVGRPSHAAAASDGAVRASLAPLGLVMASRWSQDGAWLAWEMDFTGEGPRSGHGVTLDLPMLDPALQLFTPGDRGVVDLSVLPTHKPVAYGAYGWGGPSGRIAYVLPLVSVFDPASDSALTIALAPDSNIPHLQVEWIEARTLRLTLGQRGMGGGKPSPLRILFATHAADYRSALAAYANRFPAYFEPSLPQGHYEGAFYYHHIQDHPDFLEMERQNVRYIWSSFWFTHLGNYLPEEREWYPYTYAKWWSLRQKMSDGQINAFIEEILPHHIGTFAYFNVTEYGGGGGRSGDTAEANRLLRERFANALIKDAQGNAIPTWEGAMAMNPGAGYALRPFLDEQVRRHLQRLPNFEGFIIDRLDWASTLDYGHDDGLSMVGNRPVENLAMPVSEAVQEVCRLSHAAGKRVLVNQFWKVEMLRDVDGSCHESDYLAQRYLIPFRPAAAWQASKPYATQDLAPFEAHCKQRLQIALVPQMIAHRFPISQQAANERAADLQELFTPLFKAFAGRRQVLRPHCVSASGANDVNLFTDAQGRYLAPLTSRARFLTRGDRATETAQVTLSVPDAAGLTWAHAIPLGDSPYQAEVKAQAGRAIITARRHSCATLLVVGAGPEPRLDDPDSARLSAVRDARFPRQMHATPVTAVAPTGVVTRARLRLTGDSFYHPGPCRVQWNGATVGTLEAEQGSFPCALKALANPEVRIIAADDGAWYLPRHVELAIETEDGTRVSATWERGGDLAAGRTTRELVLSPRWNTQGVTPTTAVWKGLDGAGGGAWTGRFGSLAAWVAGTPSAESVLQKGFRLEVSQGDSHTWAPDCDDPRALVAPDTDGKRRVAACWFHRQQVVCEVTPTDRQPYRLTAYVLDYDRASRSVEASLTDALGDRLDVRPVSATDMGRGVYLTWAATGTATLQLRYSGTNANANAAISAVFIDR